MGGCVMVDKNDSMLAQKWRAEMRHLIGSEMAEADPDDIVPDDIFDALAEAATRAALWVLSDAADESYSDGAHDGRRAEVNGL